MSLQNSEIRIANKHIKKVQPQYLSEKCKLKLHTVPPHPRSLRILNK